MGQMERYAPFRPRLTPEQRDRIGRAESPMEEYGRIAIAEANRQLSLLENTAAGQNALLDGAFDATDRSISGHMAERGDHILIDGRTARELLAEGAFSPRGVARRAGGWSWDRRSRPLEKE